MIAPGSLETRFSAHSDKIAAQLLSFKNIVKRPVVCGVTLLSKVCLPTDAYMQQGRHGGEDRSSFGAVVFIFCEGLSKGMTSDAESYQQDVI